MKRRQFLTTAAGAIAGAAAAKATGPHQGTSPGDGQMVAEFTADFDHMAAFWGYHPMHVLRRLACTMEEGDRFYHGASRAVDGRIISSQGGWISGQLMKQHTAEAMARRVGLPPQIENCESVELAKVNYGQNIHETCAYGDAQVYWVVGSLYVDLTYRFQNDREFVFRLGLDKRESAAEDLTQALLAEKHSGRKSNASSVLAWKTGSVPQGDSTLVRFSGPVIDQLLEESRTFPFGKRDPQRRRYEVDQSNEPTIFS